MIPMMSTPPLAPRAPRSPLRAGARPLAAGTAAVAVLSIVVSMLLSIGGVGVGAQEATPPTPFPRPLMAFVPVPANGPADPALAVQTVAVGEGTGIGAGGDRRVTVGFASSFALPTEAYRVSVVWGSPGGSQTRASFLSTGGTTSGAVQTSTDGRTWDDAGVATATFGDDSIAIDAALGDAPEGAGLWVQAQLGTDAAKLVTTPVYAVDAALGRTTDGALPATSWGVPASAEATGTGPQSAAVAFGTAPPTLAVVNQALIVTDAAPAPTQVGGQAVTAVMDEVTFLPGYTPSGTVSGVVQIDRTTGTIRALSGSTGLPEDRTGSGSWITQGLAPAPASSTAPMKVTFDLEGVTKALGITLDANGTGLGLRRKVALADGTMVLGLPVTGTVAWYQTASVPTEAPPTSSTPPAPAPSDPSNGSSNASVPLAAAGVVAVVLVALAVASTVRRRRRVGSIQTDLFGSVDAPGPGEEPDEQADERPEADEKAEANADERPDHDAGDDADEDADEGPAPARGGRSPADVLAALDAQVEGLSARVEQLGRPVGPPDDGIPPDPGPGAQ